MLPEVRAFAASTHPPLLRAILALGLLTAAPTTALALGEGALLPPASRLDPRVTIKAAPPSPKSAGTAFSIAASGLWLSAGHVLEGCRQAVLVVGAEQGVAAQVWLDPLSDVAVLTTPGGAPALPLGLDRPLRIGDRGLHAGFPQAKPGEAATRLLGRQGLVVRRAGRRTPQPQPVLAWALVERTPGLDGDLDGLSGAPVLDADGWVVGLTLAEAPRVARLYTTAPEALAAALARAGVRAEPAEARPISAQTWSLAADDLRRDLSIAQVQCLQR